MRFGVFARPGVSSMFIEALADLGLRPSVVVTRDPRREPRTARATSRARAAALALATPALRTPLGDPAQRVSNTWLAAHRHGFETIDLSVLDRDDAPVRLAALGLDWWFVFGFGLLSDELLSTATHGAIGFHPSLLPAHRGASPVYWTVRAGETESGFSLFRLDSGVDAGPVLLQRRVPLSEDDDASSGIDHVCRVGARAFARWILALDAGMPLPEPLTLGRAQPVEPQARRSPPLVTGAMTAEALRREVRAGLHLGGASLEATGERIADVLDVTDLVEAGDRRQLANGRWLLGWRCADDVVVALVVTSDG